MAAARRADPGVGLHSTLAGVNFRHTTLWRFDMRKIIATTIAAAAVVAFTASAALAFGDCSGGKYQQTVKTDAPITTAQTPILQPAPKTDG
jgi:hypothetical protein